jgi:hypothetical protein
MDTLRRKEKVAERIKKPYKYKAMRKLTLRFYSTVIAPVVLYGMPGTYLTKSNRMALRTMEETILTVLRRC